MRPAPYLPFLFLAACIVPAHAEQEPVQLKIFGRPKLGSMYTCTMGLSEASIKKLKTQQAREQTIGYWCKENSTAVSPKYRRLFKDHPVSYVVTFQGKSDIGRLRPTSSVDEGANDTALKLLRQAAPLTTPPTDLPYQRGLLIRFSSLGMTVALAPEKS